MKQEIVFIFVEDYLDWESAEALHFIAILGKDQYEIKSTGISDNQIQSVSGVRIVPSYTLEECIGKFSGLVLVGGVGWTRHTQDCLVKVNQVIEDGLRRNCSIGAIGTGVDILGILGLLNSNIHTGNSSSEIQLFNELSTTESSYNGEIFFREAGAIRNGNLVTARNTSGLAFARAYAWTLNINQEMADMMYREHRDGAALPMIDSDDKTQTQVFE